MSQNHNTNFTNLSLRTDSTVELIRELSKLGVFKSKRKTRPSSSRAANVRQASDMVGYVKALSNIGAPNVSLDQLEDIQRRNDAALATLRGEVSQQRLSDIEQQQGETLGMSYQFSNVINPTLEHFRGSQEPSASRLEPIININNLPDVQEKRFTETLNEGAPQATAARQTEVFAEDEEQEEEEGILVPSKGYEEEAEEEEPLGGGSIQDAPKKSKAVGEIGKRQINAARNLMREEVAKKYAITWPVPSGERNKKKLLKDFVKLGGDEATAPKDVSNLRNRIFERLDKMFI